MKIGIVGAGGIGAVHARHAAALSGAELFAFDSDQSKAASLVERFGGTALASMADLIATVDAAVVCTPTDIHAPVTLELLKAGKHVLCEKPISISLAKADEMVAAATSSILAIGQVVRFFPEHRLTHRLVEEDHAGRPALVRMRRVGGLPRNYHAWFADDERSGGVLVDLAIHDFDWLLWTLGSVKSVFAQSVRASRPDTEGDYALTTLEMESGALAHVEASWMDKSFRTSIEVSGPKGCIEFDTRQSPSVRIDTKESSQAFSPNAGSTDPYFLQLSAFVARIKGEPSDIASGAEGRDALKIALAAVESARTGETIQIK